MAQTPHTPPKPNPPQPPPKPAAHAGADPQEVKLDPPQPAPPRWDEPKEPEKALDPWTPEPDRYPASEHWPEGYYVDGMPAAVEQRARAAWYEKLGMEKVTEELDERDEADKPKFQKDAIAEGGAWVAKTSGGKTVAGVSVTSKNDPHGARP